MNLRRLMLGVLIVLSLSVVVARIVLVRQQNTLYTELGVIVPPKAVISVPTGYLASGLSGGGMGDARCVVIRYVESTCAYCARDREAWDGLMRALSAVGCRPLGVVPAQSARLSASIYGYGAEDQLSLTTMDWVNGYHPTLPPSVVVVGRGGKILWHQIGALQPGDAAGALQTVRRELR